LNFIAELHSNAALAVPPIPLMNDLDERGRSLAISLTIRICRNCDVTFAAAGARPLTPKDKDRACGDAMKGTVYWILFRMPY
jgi:hypothetical protein